MNFWPRGSRGPEGLKFPCMVSVLDVEPASASTPRGHQCCWMPALVPQGVKAGTQWKQCRSGPDLVEDSSIGKSLGEIFIGNHYWTKCANEKCWLLWEDHSIWEIQSVFSDAMLPLHEYVKQKITMRHFNFMSFLTYHTLILHHSQKIQRLVMP
jgi:hypothetical protein